MTPTIQAHHCSKCGKEIEEGKRLYHADQDDLICLECAKTTKQTDTAYAGQFVSEMPIERLGVKKRVACIQTQNRGGSWDDCEHTSWKELKEDGWVFEYLNLEGCAVMSRNGYINVFRNDPTMEDQTDIGKGWVIK